MATGGPGPAAIEIERRLATLRYATDANDHAHITVKAAVCAPCPHSRCMIVWVANCYERIEGRLVFRYEDCVQCGACDIACDPGSVTWTFPRGPYGVRSSYD